MSYYWQLRTYINGGDQRIRLEYCPELGICREPVSATQALQGLRADRRKLAQLQRHQGGNA